MSFAVGWLTCIVLAMAVVKLLQNSAAVVVLGLASLGCRSVPPLPPDDLSRPGWTVRQGQAVWKTRGSELAGELIFASRPDGSSSLLFIKTPLPLVTAQNQGPRWTVRFVADNRTFSGLGVPPAQLLWVHLARALTGAPVPAPLEFQSAANWQLTNPKTEEAISGFLMP
jgi:hypothetical protein